MKIIAIPDNYKEGSILEAEKESLQKGVGDDFMKFLTECQRKRFSGPDPHEATKASRPNAPIKQ